jgi:hypothetical protein
MDGTPHRMVDNVCTGIVKSITGFLDSGANAIKNTGRSITQALDTPFEDITGKKGPIKMLDSVGDGIIDAGVNFVDSGIVGSARTAKEGFMKALDQPPEQIGFPPNLGKLDIFKKSK